MLLVNPTSIDRKKECCDCDMRRPQGNPSADDDDLVRRFVASFQPLDGLDYEDSGLVPEELAAEPDVEDKTIVHWQPVATLTHQEHLAPIYQKLPGRFPALYERLVLSYRWLRIHLGTVMLLANPPGPTLDGLAAEVFRDPVLINTLIPAGFVPFGMVSGGGYDPMCFDLNARKHDDCPVIQIEHESVLCHDRIGKTWQRYSSFRELIFDTIDRAQTKRE
jgi:hypothetical protein